MLRSPMTCLKFRDVICLGCKISHLVDPFHQAVAGESVYFKTVRPAVFRKAHLAMFEVNRDFFTRMIK